MLSLLVFQLLLSFLIHIVVSQKLKKASEQKCFCILTHLQDIAVFDIVFIIRVNYSRFLLLIKFSSDFKILFS